MAVEQEMTPHQEKIVKDAKWATGTAVGHGVAAVGTLTVANLAQKFGVSPESTEILFITGLAEFGVIAVALLNSYRRLGPLLDEIKNVGSVLSDVDARNVIFGE